MKIIIAVAAHKPYTMPQDDVYVPVQAGSLGKETIAGYARDDEGDNISSLNPYYSELTCLYWAWRNLEYDCLGLAHYRRHFKGHSGIITGREVEKILGGHDVIVPKKRRYYIQTVYSHYADTFSAEQLDCCRDIIRETCPEYLESFDRVMNRRWGYMFNMFIMKKEMADACCSWLFPVLEKVRLRMDNGSMNGFEKRFVGRVSERLFNVWLEYCLETGKIDKQRVYECKWMYLEKINYLDKAKAFLMAKFFGKKYEKSF